MLPEDVLYLPVTELGQRIRSRSLSPVELTEAYLDRISRYAARFNAFATVTAVLARSQAKQAEEEIQAGTYRGPLHGIPYGVKDLAATRGIATTWGAKPHASQVFDYDATVVVKLREAGAVLLGKLSMVELAGGLGYHFAHASLQGPGRNPWDPGRWTGGSSSGPGAAVAAGLVAFAIGSETWGSIVCPSSFCGVSGLRPTYGRVSRHGAMALSWTMDKLGPMCRTASDCRAVLSAIAGPDPSDPTASVGPTVRASSSGTPASEFKLGYVPTDFSKNGDKEVDALVRAAVEELKSAGMSVQEIQLPQGPWEEAAVSVIQCEAVSSFEPLFRSGKVKELTEPKAAHAEEVADMLTGRDYLKALRIRAVLLEKINRVFEDVDAIVSPGIQYFSTPIEADLNKVLPGSDPVGGIGNLAGLPAACVPCGFGSLGLPAGLVVMGPAYGEETVLRITEIYQERTRWTERHPKLA